MEEALRAALISDGFPSEDIQFPKDISQAQVYNLLIPVVPIVILSPHSAEHVSIAIRAAKSFGLRVQARSGGHSYANHCLGGVDGHMVLDMKHMKDLYINRETWIAHIGPGLRLNELAWTLHDNGGRMIPQGTCGNVGLGGTCIICGLDVMNTGRFVGTYYRTRDDRGNGTMHAGVWPNARLYPRNGGSHRRRRHSSNK
jgi:hypothetical protein